jgi:dihydrofolate reductase
MILALIAAHDENLVIGKDGDLPWHIPEDLRYFTGKTKGHPLVMGRKTWESIGAVPLKNRENIVISRSGNWDNATVFKSLDAALEYLKDRDLVYIGGGAGIYEETLPIADKLVLTHVSGKHDGDTFFPEYRDQIGTVWIESFREDHDGFSFVTYERNSGSNV